MKTIITLGDIQADDLRSVGGKALALAQLKRHGYKIAETLCVTTVAYTHYIEEAGLGERILLELNRKDPGDLRWEEVWDSALRIRNLFLKTPIPEQLRQELHQTISQVFGEQAVVVRSSAPAEDSAMASFAGLHESFVNIHGADAILEHIRLVWASLWSDAAILYRQELGLDIKTSAMAVVIQTLIHGQRSGVVFSQSPTDSSQLVLEAIYGLNQGLVDGTIEPDRWILERTSETILQHSPAQRSRYLLPGDQGIRLEPLPAPLAVRPPLCEEDVRNIARLARQLETFSGVPQDIEWTIQDGELYVLQSRPITTVKPSTPQDDRRQWDLSLRRSYGHLLDLRAKIEEQWIPAMIADAERLAVTECSTLSDRELAQEIERRLDVFTRWKEVYWTDFIPFAHGIRLFGQFYTDVVCPDDPYEFVDLLQSTPMQSLERNVLLADMAANIRETPEISRKLRDADWEHLPPQFAQKWQSFRTRYGDLSFHSFRGGKASQELKILVNIVLEMAAHPPVSPQTTPNKTARLTAAFLERFETIADRTQAAELLDLGRCSYQLRDDDNIYLGRIEDQLHRVVREGHERLKRRGQLSFDDCAPEDTCKALLDPAYLPKEPPKTHFSSTEETDQAYRLSGRQLVGQPAGPGLVRGTARVIVHASDLADFTSGEILICDAIDPTMTFIVPLAAGIVERRGGMLIHGAIIAREYGLPCVTGVPNATQQIHSGDQISVDGYLGIVTRHAPPFAMKRPLIEK